MTPIEQEIEKLAEKYRVGGVLHIDNNGGMLGANFVTYSNFASAMRELIPLIREECAKRVEDGAMLPIEDWMGTKKDLTAKLCTSIADAIRNGT